MGVSKQVEVFGKPVFTEATDPREKSPIRWSPSLFSITFKCFREIEYFAFITGSFSFNQANPHFHSHFHNRKTNWIFCIHPQNAWCWMEDESREKATWGGNCCQLWKTNFLRKELAGEYKILIWHIRLLNSSTVPDFQKNRMVKEERPILSVLREVE